jgi:hypothetical protein
MIGIGRIVESFVAWRCTGAVGNAKGILSVRDLGLHNPEGSEIDYMQGFLVILPSATHGELAGRNVGIKCAIFLIRARRASFKSRGG